MTENRNSRNIALFGAEGQRRIAQAKVTIVGLGGLGASVAEDLAYLGVLDYRLVDRDVVDASNLNRLKGATPSDVGQKKVLVAKAMIEAIQPEAIVDDIDAWLASTPREAITESDVVFGCLDKDIHRVELIKLCIDAGVPFFDLATDVIRDDAILVYGGRVLWSGDCERCPYCMDLLDQEAMRRDSLSPEQRFDYDKIYGIPKNTLGDTGPSVVSVNGVVASTAVTEFMVWATRLRSPKPLITYRADHGSMRVSLDRPGEGCPYCSTARRAAA
jgi:molybdopterin/thiamine biosynthesis adenylyltransferase